MRRYIPSKTKNQVKALRKKGYSIGFIAKKCSISKSTVHEWVKTMRGANRYARLGKERWIKEIQPLGALSQRRKRERKIVQIEKEVNEEIAHIQITTELKKTALASLYWAEGTKGKGKLVFANTDPRLMLLFITLLRESYILDESKFRVRIHLHWYHKERATKKFWSDLLKIPTTQFNKTYRKKRSKEKVFRKNVGGICFLGYNSDYLREQVLHYAHALGRKITDTSIAPVA